MKSSLRICQLERMSLNGFLGSQSGLKCTDRGFAHHPLSRFRDVICPKPRRAKAHFTSDSLDRCSCRTKRNLALIGGDTNHEIRDFFDLLLNGDDLDGSDRKVGLYNCSPPVRTENPIVHDIQFLSQASKIDFHFQSTHMAVLNGTKEKEISISGPL